MKNLSIIDRIFFLLNCFSLTLLILSYTSPYISPVIFWPIAFLGLLFPMLFCINICFLIYWFIKLKKHILPNIIILLFGLQYIGSYIGIDPEKDNDKKTIKILSYNVRVFNKYQWIPNLKQETIFKFIMKEKADILCIQEFYTTNNIPNLNYKFHHVGMQNKKSEWHMAIYSNFPQINKSTVEIENKKMNNTCIYSDIVIGSDTIRIYNIHLASNWFKSNDYAFLTDSTIKKDKIRKGLLNMMNDMINSYHKRANQAVTIKQHMNQSPYPIIVCGDFNDTPLSYAYQTIKRGLVDSFNSSGKGLGESFVKIPGLRIDYIMHDKKFQSTSYQKIDKIFSDHYPISCRIKL